ncbi:MAG: swr complex subunit [Thelocarpon impressellum]|nr:MAG: swr complex subunit [Thelocarpon impressellum]
MAEAADDEPYKSSDDEDFNPTAAAADAGEDSSSSEEEASRPSKRKKEPASNGLDGDFENSGDEATIRRGKKRQRKRRDEEENDDEDGEGGLIKTRAQRAKEGKERKPLASVADATVDVDALWASMQGPGSKPEQKTGEQAGDGGPSTSGDTHGSMKGTAQHAATEGPVASETITVKRTYDFAGETISEEKVVPRASAEATLFLQSQQRPPPAQPKPGLRRPKKRTSMFETSASTSDAAAPAKAPKLNTIEKSKLDWAGFVDKEGIADELDEHSKAKEGYLGRMDFLGRVEAKREEERRNARGK